MIENTEQTFKIDKDSIPAKANPPANKEVTPDSNIEKNAEQGPNGFANKKGYKENKEKPKLPLTPTEHNKNNAPKLEKLNKFNKPSITVGFFTKTAAELMESQHRVRGKKSIHRMGLNGFDRKIRKVNNAVRDDNPVADTIFFEIETLITSAHHEISTLISGMQQKTERFFVSHHAGISYDQDYAYSYEANWTNSISYKIMWLIKDADIYFNQLNLASKAAIITEQNANNARHQVQKRLLNIMHFVNHFKDANITRTDIAHMTPAAQKYLESKADNVLIQSAVLMLEKRAESAPRISIRPMNKIDDLKDKLQPFYDLLHAQEEQTFFKETPKALKEAF